MALDLLHGSAEGNAMWIDRLQRTATLFGIFVVLLVLLIGIADHRGWRTRAIVAIPYAPGRAVQLRIWTVHVLETNGARSIDSRWAGLWYQRRSQGAMRFITASTLPVWPLWAVGGGWVGLVGAAGLRRRQARRADQIRVHHNA